MTYAKAILSPLTVEGLHHVAVHKEKGTIVVGFMDPKAIPTVRGLLDAHGRGITFHSDQRGLVYENGKRVTKSIISQMRETNVQFVDLKRFRNMRKMDRWK